MGAGGGGGGKGFSGPCGGFGCSTWSGHWGKMPILVLNNAGRLLYFTILTGANLTWVLGSGGCIDALSSLHI